MRNAIIFQLFICLFLFLFTVIVVYSYKIKIKESFRKVGYYPKKSREIYKTIWVRGGAFNADFSNTLAGFDSVISAGKEKRMGISTCVRLNKDGIFYCFGDRYTYRMLNTPGKFLNKTSEQLEMFTVCDTEEEVPKLIDALIRINGRVPVLIEAKGFLKQYQVNELYYLVSYYNGEIYFHCKNLLTYHKMIKVFEKNVFWRLNILRRSFQFLEGISYKKAGLPTNLDLSLAIEENENVQSLVFKIWYAVNRHKTRVKDDDSLLTKPIAHRGIVEKGDPEHSINSIVKCVDVGVIPEFDVTFYSGELICYHSDKFSGKVIKQPSSCAEKLNISNSPRVKDILSAINREDAIVILDIKDAHYSNRRLEKMLIKQIGEVKFKGTIYVQCFNPFVVRWFYRYHPEYKRGIVCNSLSGIKGLPEWFRTLVNALLSSYCKPDYIAYDFGKLVPIFSQLIATIGLPVLLYAPKCKAELKEYRGYYKNVIGENYMDIKSWKGLYGFDGSGKIVRLKKY